MFSKEFIHTLANANAQDDLTMERMATVIPVLWREVQRLERSVVIKHDEITLKTGDASIVLKFDGSVVIRGNNITVESGGRTSIKASSDLVLKGSKIVTN